MFISISINEKKSTGNENRTRNLQAIKPNDIATYFINIKYVYKYLKFKSDPHFQNETYDPM